MVDGLLIAGVLLLSVVGGLLFVRDNRRRFIREKPDWSGFALVFIGATLVGFALAWLLGARDPLYLASMVLFSAIFSFGTCVWPPMPRD
jgi:CDP-diglyceride synthetase